MVVLSGCDATSSDNKSVSAGKSGGTLNYFLGEPASIDPAHALESEGMQVIKAVFDGLVDYDPKTLELKPAAATRWRSNKAGDEWTFWLREGAKFHNGDPVRADDFIFAWNRVAAKKTASEVAYHLAPIQGFGNVQEGEKSKMSGLSAPETYVLKVKLAYPFADFPKILGHPVFSPVPQGEVGKNARKFATKPVGNGPFALKEPWRRQETIVLERFEDYYGRPAFLDGVKFKIIDSEQTAFLQFQGGALDYASIPGGQISVVAKQFKNTAIVGEPLLVLNFYGFNLREKVFAENVKLRRAISYAVNRGVIANEIYEGAFVPAGGIVPSGISDYKKPKNAFTYSPAKARKLLKEAGHPGGKGVPKLTLIYGAGRGHDGPAQVMQENLRQLGVRLELKALERDAFFKALMSGKMSMFAGSWQGDYPSRDAFLYSLFHSESGDNMVGYANKKVDKLLVEARRAEKERDRRKLYDQAEELILQDTPIVPVTFVGTSVVHAAKVKGFVRTPLDDTPLDQVWLAD
jgi:peptide/nickel transport system substrate-binding protein/oligopeptide transport system substrate-binding protein